MPSVLAAAGEQSLHVVHQRIADMYLADGFAYRGRIAALEGKFVFGDIYNGRVFVSDLAAMKKADDGIPQTVAPVEEVQLYVRDASGKRVDVSLHDLIAQAMGKPAPRADPEESGAVLPERRDHLGKRPALRSDALEVEVRREKKKGTATEIQEPVFRLLSPFSHGAHGVALSRASPIVPSPDEVTPVTR
jgi:hypothetical protein